MAEILVVRNEFAGFGDEQDALASSYDTVSRLYEQVKNAREVFVTNWKLGLTTKKDEDDFNELVTKYNDVIDEYCKVLVRKKISFGGILRKIKTTKMKDWDEYWFWELRCSWTKGGLVPVSSSVSGFNDFSLAPALVAAVTPLMVKFTAIAITATVAYFLGRYLVNKMAETTNYAEKFGQRQLEMQAKFLEEQVKAGKMTPDQAMKLMATSQLEISKFLEETGIKKEKPSFLEQATGFVKETKGLLTIIGVGIGVFLFYKHGIPLIKKTTAGVKKYGVPIAKKTAAEVKAEVERLRAERK